MNASAKCLLFLGLIAPLAASADPVIYDFTGVVTSGGPIGAVVTGIYEFDYSFANPSQGSGTIGSANFDAESFGGAANGSWGSMYPTPPAGYVFSSEAQIAGTNIAYASTPFTSYGGGSVVLAQTTISPGSFAASESSYTSPNEGPGSFFNFTAAAGTTPYTSAGFPVFSAGDSGIGAFYFSIQSPEIEYSITSITLAPVPLPGSAWLMLAGLGGLGMFLRRDCKLR